jgi:oxygen-dependent protoporphyrinogen oxidase
MMEARVREQDQYHIAVIGGGIAGLSAAYTLQNEAASANLAVSITLVDAGEKLGGKIVTEQVGEFTIEGGPDCFIRQKPWAAELAHSLGIQADLMGTNDHQRKVYVLDRGRLTSLPDGVMLIIPTRIMPFVLSPLISWPGKIRMGLDWFISRRAEPGDETVANFVRRRLGREALEKIAEPLLSGIHVSDPEKQSLLATFPRFRAIEEKHGSLIRGMLAERKAAQARQTTGAKPGSIFMTFKQGVSQLIQALEAALTGCRILKQTRAVSVTRAGNGQYLVELSSGETLSSDAVILATPAFISADLLAGLAPQTAGLLRAIDYVSTATISLAFRKQDIQKPFMGFGFVIPGKEKRQISACTWTSYKFDHRAPQDHLLLRCFVGGPGKEDMVELDDAAMVEIARAELAQILGLRAEPVLTRIYRWRKANPQYNLGHLEHVRSIFETCAGEAPGIRLTGSAYEGVGIPDCVNQGKKAAQQVIQFLQKRFVR